MKVILLGLAIVASACRTQAGGVDRPTARSMRCSEADSNTAEAALHELGTLIEAEGPDASPDVINQKLQRILSTDCFAYGSENPRRPQFQHSLQAKSWWEHGGRAWLQSLIRSSPWVSVPPDVVPVIDVKQLDQTGQLQCALGDETCGLETRGWALRAEETWNTGSAEAEANAALCDMASERVQDVSPYASWRACIEARRNRRPTLPLGRIRAPMHGWVAVRGSSDDRDPVRPCDELRIFSVETGAAYVLKSCQARGRASASRTAVVGITSVDAVREALWGASLASQVQMLQPVAETHRLPTNIERVPIPAIQNVAYADGPRRSQRGLEWSWILDGRVVGAGRLAPDDSGHPGDAYAEVLWRVAWASIRPECPPQPLPVDLSSVDQVALDELAAHGNSVCASHK